MRVCTCGVGLLIREAAVWGLASFLREVFGTLQVSSTPEALPLAVPSPPILAVKQPGLSEARAS